MTPKCKQTIKEIINHFNYKCTIDTFEEYKGKNWTNVSRYSYLSEDFIREFQDEIDWTHISISQQLSEEFMTEYKNFVWWKGISRYQTLSEKLIRKFKHKIDWTDILQLNKRINIDNFSDDFFSDFSDKIKKFGTKKQIQRLENILNNTVDRTYDIIL